MQILKTCAGDVVRVRQRTWRIRDVRTYDDCALVTLSGVGSSRGLERLVLSPFETIDRIPRTPRLNVVSRQRWRRACRDVLAAGAPIGALKWAARARIDLLPHQLEPALAIVRGLGSRALIADDVGLGKTIQAALVIAELRARGACERALILTPAGLREQWIAELAARFEIDATLVDSRGLRRRRAELPIGVNPWSTIATAVASFDFVKRPDVLRSVAACRWDVVIVDEAHNVAGDNDRRVACTVLASRAPYVLLLTATPHSGDRNSFVSLCSIGAHGDSILVFRRTRADAGIGGGRRVRLLEVRPSAAERRMHSLLAKLNSFVFRELSTDSARDDHDANWLALAVLNKRALSSARSLQVSVDRRLAAVQPRDIVDAWQPVLPLFDRDGEIDGADEAPNVPLTFRNPAEGRALLGEVGAAARAAAHAGETKIAALVRLLRRVREPAVVFTEYRDTLAHVQRHLERSATVLHGGLSREERRAALDEFAAGRRSVLVATDAAGEGLNLHHACRLVINLELPWNPMRLEQRIGRVDRIGQHRRVHAVHLVARDTKEMDVLERLRVRVARAKADVDAADPLPPCDERAVARSVIGSDPLAVEHPLEIAWPQRVTSVKADARVEAERLAGVRRLMTRASTTGVVAPRPMETWLAHVRKARTRAALGSRALLVFLATCEDGDGRVLESMLVPIALDLDPGLAAVAPTRDCVRLIEPSACVKADEAISKWRDDVVRAARHVFDARIARERGIASLHDMPEIPLQQGLFDRRAARQDDLRRAAASDAGAETARQIRALEHAAQVSIGPTRLVLVLIPKFAGCR